MLPEGELALREITRGDRVNRCVVALLLAGEVAARDRLIVHTGGAGAGYPSDAPKTLNKSLVEYWKTCKTLCSRTLASAMWIDATRSTRRATSTGEPLFVLAPSSRASHTRSRSLSGLVRSRQPRTR
eukprot:1834677-Pyramimonas_sp.AAC.1